MSRKTGCTLWLEEEQFFELYVFVSGLRVLLKRKHLCHTCKQRAKIYMFMILRFQALAFFRKLKS